MTYKKSKRESTVHCRIIRPDFSTRQSMGFGKEDLLIQEGDNIPPPNYRGQLTLISQTADTCFAVFSGGMFQPFIDSSDFDVLTKGDHCHTVFIYLFSILSFY